MIKKILKWSVIIILLLVILVCTGCYVFVHWFAKDIIESQLENVLHRNVEIRAMKLNIFSTEPEILIQDLIIADQKLNEKNKADMSEDIALKDRFVDIKSIQCLLKLMPILNAKLELSALLLKEPKIRVVRFPDGSFNFSDLIKPPEKKKAVTQKKSEQPSKPVDKKPPQTAKPSAPKKEPPAKSKTFSADDLPIHIIIGNIGIKNGHIKLFDQEYQQAIHLKKMNVLLHDTNINPKNLEQENIIKLDISTNVKSEGKLKAAWAKTFDFDVLFEASIQPFNVKTRLLDPQATIKTGSPSGVVSGLQLYESIRSILMNYEIKALNILKEDLNWKNAIVDLDVNQRVVQLKEGAFEMDKLIVNTDGKFLIENKAVDLAVDVLLDNKEQEKIETAVKTFIAKQIDSRASKYVSADKISQNIMDSLLSKDGRIHLIFSVSGPLDKPKTKLAHPKLPALKGIVAQALKNVKDRVVNELKQKAKNEVDKIKQKADKELDKLKDKYLKKEDKEAGNVLDSIKDNVLKKLPFSF
ncbi:secreted protein containing AsmA domain protein [Candidatus Magnetomorum sp. HK-1]|nr:secreted protein containing AsmA domain protein [Candidatus Magnetomorum sp. HK-1]